MTGMYYAHVCMCMQLCAPTQTQHTIHAKTKLQVSNAGTIRFDALTSTVTSTAVENLMRRGNAQVAILVHQAPALRVCQIHMILQ